MEKILVIMDRINDSNSRANNFQRSDFDQNQFLKNKRLRSSDYKKNYLSSIEEKKMDIDFNLPLVKMPLINYDLSDQVISIKIDFNKFYNLNKIIRKSKLC